MEIKKAQYLDNLPIPVGVSNSQGEIIYINKAFTSFFGYSHVEICTIQKWSTLAYPDENYRKESLTIWAKDVDDVMMKREKHTPRVYKISCKDLSIKDVSLSFSIYGKDVLVVFNDVTIQEDYLHKFKQSELKLNSIINNLPSVVYRCVMDKHWTMKMISPQIEKISGYPASDFIENNKRTYASIIHPDDADMVEETVVHNVERNLAFTINYRIIDKHNNTKWVYEKGTAQYNPADDIMWLDGVINDITDQMQTSLEVLDKKQKLAALYDNTNVGITIVTPQSRIIACNKAFIAISGFSQKELINTNLLALSPSEYSEQEQKYIQSLLKCNSKSYTIEKEIECKDKTLKWVRVNVVCVKKTNNKVAFLMGIIEDINELKTKEKIVRENEKMFRDIFHTTSDAMFIFDHDFRVITANNVFLELMAITQEELPDFNMFKYILDKDAEKAIKAKVKSKNKKGRVNNHYTICNKEGRKFPIETRSKEIIVKGKDAFLTTFNDISERKNIERQILHASINAEESERERLAKDLHDGLGPVLSACKLYLHTIKESCKDEPDAINALESLIGDALKSIKDISNNISPLILRNYGLIAALESFVKTVNHLCHTEITHNLSDKTTIKETISITLYRIIIELITNTIKHAEAHNIYIHINSDENLINIIYKDDGCGFLFTDAIKKEETFGLKNIISRTNSIGGVCEFKQQSPQGTLIEISVCSI